MLSDKDDCSLYKPLNEYKPFARNIGVVDGPFEYLTMLGVRLPLPFTTRMTVVKLKNGDLFLHSPIAFDAALAKSLRSLGTVRHLVSPDQFHYAHIGGVVASVSGRAHLASPHAPERARAHGIDVKFKKELVADALAEWHDEMDQTVIPWRFLEKSSSSTKIQRHSYSPTPL